MGIPLKQGNAQFFFNPLKLLVQPGLGDKQFVCGLGDTAAFRNGQDVIQLSCIHNADSFLSSKVQSQTKICYFCNYYTKIRQFCK